MPEIYALSRTHFFAPEAKEFVIEPAGTGREFIKDILISFSAEIVFPRAGLPANSGLNGLHLYFNGKDITKAYLKAVRAKLEADANARQQYQAGIARWMAFITYLANNNAFIGDLAAEQNRAAQLRDASWDQLVTWEGALSFGYQGAMNPFFFFGRDMTTQRISISEILGLGDGGLDPISVKDWRLIISHGRSSILEGELPVIGASYRGVGTLNAEYLHEDPWRTQLLAALETMSRDMQALLEEARDIKVSAQTAGQRLTAIASLEESLSGSLETLAGLIEPRTGNGL